MGRLVVMLILVVWQTSFAEDAGEQESEFHFREVMAPLMPLSEQPTLLVNMFNREKLILTEKEKLASVQVLEGKNFPWLVLISFLMSAAAITLIKLFPPSPKAVVPPSAPTKEEIRQKAQELLAHPPATSEGSLEYFSKLDDTMKKYIQTQYQIPIEKYTTEEFIKKAPLHSELDTATRLKILKFLQDMDRIKFAHVQLKAGENQKVVEIVREILK